MRWGSLAVLALFVLALSGCGACCGAEPGKANFSSPEATVATLIQACAAGDKTTLGACFAEDCEKEFKPLADPSGEDEMFRSFFDFFQGAEITGSEGSVVNVKLSARDEQIHLKKEDGKWKIVGF